MIFKKKQQDLLKVGFIGCGKHALVNLYPCFQYVAVELIATCAQHKKNAEQTAKKFGAQRAYDDYKEMIENEELDAVFIAVGAEKHFEICAHALSKGLHVFVEKPATCNLDQAQKLAGIAETSNRQIMVGFMKRFAPTNQKARDIIGTKEFGPLTAIQTKFCVGPYMSEEQFLLDVAIHHVDLIRFYGGEIQSIHVKKHINEKDGAFSFVISFKFNDGAVGSSFLSSGQSWHTQNERVEIYGKKESVVIDNIISYKHYKNGTLTQTANSQTLRDNVFWEPNFSVPSESNQTLFLNGFAYEIRHFVESILNDKKPFPDIADYCRTIQILETIRAVE